MAVHLSFLLILTGLTGIHSITTVSEVSVKAGRSISIPCLYDSQYRNNVKYLCKGYYWNSCSYAVKTNNQRSGKFSISDDRSQRVFTVTINDLTDQDTNYWCIVEINGGTDVGRYFHLSVTRGTPSLYVDSQKITAVEGDNTTIKCDYRTSGEARWCRLGSSCVSGSSGSIAGTRVTIDKSVSNVFTVTMSGLRTEDSGWYWCVKGDVQMPVHLTVDEKPTTNKAPTTVQSHQGSSSVPVDLMSFIIPLIVLIFIAMVTLFIWFMLKRHKQNKEESSATTVAGEEITYNTVKIKTPRPAEEDVTYSDVQHVRKTSPKTSGAEMASDVDVMYSSVAAVGVKHVQRVEAKAEDVTYSTLAQHH